MQKLWDGLRRVRSVRFVCRSDTPERRGSGVGSVATESPSESILVYRESGHWQPGTGRELSFTNVFRWTHNRPELIRLEHLRFGLDHPVFLLNVALGADGEWSSVQPHLCERDCYTAKLSLQISGVWLTWIVTGPKKNDRIEYLYSW